MTAGLNAPMSFIATRNKTMPTATWVLFAASVFSAANPATTSVQPRSATVLVPGQTLTTPARPSSKVAPVQAGQALSNATCLVCVFGPNTYVRSFGGPETSQGTFSGDPAADYLIDIDDAESQGADGSVSLNGQVLLAPRSALEVGPRHLRTAVRLNVTNTISIRLSGKPGSTLKVSVIGGTKELGINGGTLVLPGGDVSLEVPPGALEAATEIGIVPVAAAQLPAGLEVGPIGSTGWELSPSGLHFGVPVKLHVRRTALSATPTGYLDTDLLIAHVSKGGAVSEVIEPQIVDSGQGIQFTVRHFSVTFPFWWAGGHTDPSGAWRVFGFKWGTPKVKWFIEPPQTSPTILTTGEVSAALAQWQSSSSLRFEQAATRQEANIVFVEEGALGSVVNSFCLTQGGYGQTCYPLRTYVGAPILGSSDQVTVHMASEDLGLSEDDIRSSLLHEIGHAVGIAHTPSGYVLPPEAPVMCQCDTFSLALRAEDVDAVRYLYPPTAAVAFNNFGPGNTFNTVSSLPVANALFGSFSSDKAMTFVADASGPLERVELPLRLLVGAGIAEVLLMQDAGGSPGPVMESVPVTSVPTGFPSQGANVVVSAISSSHSTLVAGESYWLVVRPTGGVATLMTWYLNSTNDVGPIAVRPNVLSVWSLQVGMRAAFRVTVK